MSRKVEIEEKNNAKKTLKRGSESGLSSTAESLLVKGPRLYLRRMTESDAGPAYCGWLNDPEVMRYIESRHIQHTPESTAAYIRQINANPDNHFFAVCTLEGSRHIGNIKLGPINRIHKRGDVGLIIGEKEFWGKGFATEAIELITRFAFESLGLNKLKAGCYVVNEGSARAFEKCGWQREGLLRDEVIFESHPMDVIFMGITAADYKRKIRK